MQSRPAAWLKLVVLATALVFAGVAFYVYGLRFFRWIESDASVTAVLAARSLHAVSPVVGDWYYANGDVWVMTPHLFAILPVAVLGLGPAALLVAVVFGFLVELAALAWAYLQLCGNRMVAGFAAMVTLAAWSRTHVAYAYVQLGYGFQAVILLVAFAALAMLAVGPPARLRAWLATGAFIALIAIENPTRGMAFLVAPVAVGALWPWRDLSWRRRLTVLACTAAGWLIATVIYTAVFKRVLSFAYPPGLIDFKVVDRAAMAHNLDLLWRGIVTLCGNADHITLRATPGLIVLIGSILWVAHEVVAARALTALRLVSVIVAAQLGGVLVPLVVGNLMTDPSSVRYLMPSLLLCGGLGVLLAFRALTATHAVARWLARGWLALIPIAALIAAPNAYPPKPKAYAWPKSSELRRIADELDRRGLRHGFSNVIYANLMNLHLGGRGITCPVYFSHVLIPQRWLADTKCYTRSAMPDRFYIITDHDPRDVAALHATLPEPIEHFHVGKMYDVSVFRTADMDATWLELPIHDGPELQLPLHLPAVHPALKQLSGRPESGDLVASGEANTIVYGPYLRVPPGSYELVWTGSSIESPGELRFVVDADMGRTQLAVKVLPASEVPKARGEIVRLAFTLDRMTDTVEFPVFSSGGAKVALHDVVLRRR